MGPREPGRFLVGSAGDYAGGNVRKRRTKYTWFIPIGTVGPGADLDDTTNGIELSTTVPLNGTQAISITPLLLDIPADDLNVGQPMGFYENNDYFIKRIVGKMFVSVTQQATSSSSPGVLVSAGLFVARANDADNTLGSDFPIGPQDATGLRNEYSPMRAENMHQPWIWRRTWILGNQSFTGADGVGLKFFPRNNAEYGSVVDGPHVDAKTARRVTQEERLWWVVAARQIPLLSTADTVSFVKSYFDYRVLGAMRKTKNRGVF